MYCRLCCLLLLALNWHCVTLELVFGQAEACSQDQDLDLDGCTCTDDQMECTGRSSLPQLPAGKKINIFYFSDCTFTTLSKSNLTALYHTADTLIFEKCGITDIMPGTFGFFSRLKSLTIENNLLSNITKEQLEGALHLRYLNLAHNRITHIPLDAFDNTPSLIEINLDRNNLELPEPSTLLKGTPALEKLELRGCGLKVFPTGLLQAVRGSMRELYLSENSFPELVDDCLHGLDNLHVLTLNDCGISEISQHAFRGLDKVQQLWLENNAITEITAAQIAPMKDSLHSVYLSGNQISSLSEDVFVWDNLEEVTLGDNPWLCDCALHHLTYIDLEHLDHENITCSSPFPGQELHAVMADMTSCNSGHQAVALGVIIPILIICVFVAIFFIYRMVQNRRQLERIRRRGNYSAVYKDTVEAVSSNAAMKTPPPRPPAPPTYQPV